MAESHENRLREMPATFKGSAEWSPADRLVPAKPLKAKVFKSGNSLALRLPAVLGLEAGMEMELTATADGGYALTPAAKPKRKFNIDKVWGCAIGSGLQPIDPDDRWFEERPLLSDDPEWRAKHMPDA